MNKKPTKTRSSANQISLDGRMAHLEQTMEKLTKTVDDLAVATARGFENTVTKKDFENLKISFDSLGKKIDSNFGEHIGAIRKDYDTLTSRVKRLEEVVFKR